MAAAVAAAAAAAAALGPPVGGSLAAVLLRPIAVVVVVVVVAVVDPDLTATLSGHLEIAIVRSDVGSGVVIGGLGLGEDDMMMTISKDDVMAVVALESGTFPHPEMRWIRFGDTAEFDAVDVVVVVVVVVAGDE